MDLVYKMYRVDTGKDCIIRLIKVEYGREVCRIEKRSIQECLIHFGLASDEHDIHDWLMRLEDIQELNTQ